MSAKFAVNDRVWVRPLGKYAKVQRVIERRGVYYYRIEHWQVAQFSENLFESQQEHEAREHLQALQVPQETDAERRQRIADHIEQMREIDPCYGRRGYGWFD